MLQVKWLDSKGIVRSRNFTNIMLLYNWRGQLRGMGLKVMEDIFVPQPN